MWRRIFEVDKKYVAIKPIGQGSYGVVCSCINKKTNEKVAIKKIMDVFENRVTALRTLREMTLLRFIKHENIVELKEVMMPNNWRGFKEVYMVYELMDTDLHQLITSPQPLSNDHCRFFIFQKSLAESPSFKEPAAFISSSLLLLFWAANLKADLEFIDKPKAKMLYPKADPLAIDLLEKLLVFDPSKRITATEALCHPYMSSLYDPSCSPPAKCCLEGDVKENMEEPKIREMMLREIMYLPNPK
ncbi:hypothetical protein DH2020_040609 [Rehmannia glutinosa]